MGEAVGDDCAIAVRFGVDTLDLPVGLGDRGIRQDGEGLQFIEYMDELVDMWDINVGNAVEWGEDAAPSRTHPENDEPPHVYKVKEHTSKPVLNVGRFTNPDTMIEVIRSGQADIILGAAGHLSRIRSLPKKIEEGRLDDIRECIGCNVAISAGRSAVRPLSVTRTRHRQRSTAGGWHPEGSRAGQLG